VGRTLLRSINETKYFALLKLIHANGGVECEKHPDAFFPEDIDDPERRAAMIKLAKALCNACPLKDACFTYAIETGQRFGIWGGTVER
jgi:hypothetical protein